MVENWSDGVLEYWSIGVLYFLADSHFGHRPALSLRSKGVAGPAAAHRRQDKELVLEFEGLSRFLSTQDEGVFVFDEPL